MSKVILVASGKGGTGKTTVTSALGVLLGEKGETVIALDCDPLGGLDIAYGCGERAIYDIGDAVNGNCAMSAALAAIPLPLKKNRAAHGLLRYAKLGDVRNDAIASVFANLRKRCGYILCDCPAGSVRTELADCADVLLLVTNIGDSCNRAASAIRQDAQFGRSLEAVLAVNRVERSQLRKQRVTLDDSIDDIGAKLIGWAKTIDNLHAETDGWRRRDFNEFREIAVRLQTNE
ncbi:MAG: AAA family ATPase [Oscillospiraceae bacterium]|nr:AAA family ATPase [Oscillospiraceae bacterium]